MSLLIAHAMCAMMPEGGALPGLHRDNARAFARQVRRDSDALYYTGLLLGSVIFALSPLFTVGWPLPSFMLPTAVLDRHAQRIVAPRGYLIKQAVFVVRLNAGMAWGMQDDSRAAMHLPPYPPDPGTYRGQA